MKNSSLNSIVQVGLVSFNIVGTLLTSLKLPEYGVIVLLASQAFWLYSTHKAWKEAKQLGIFINTIIVTGIFLFGVINYWFIK